MNKKIQSLLDGGFISIEDVLEYAQAYMDACDQLDDERLMVMTEWECSEGTLHPGDQHDCDCSNYEPEYQMTKEEMEYEQMRLMEEKYDDYLDDEMKLSYDLGHSKDPEYIIASTSFKLDETYLFEADENGEIVNLCEYGGLAKRWGVEDWTNRRLAVETVFPNQYEFVRDIDLGVSAYMIHSLYKKK